MYSKISKLAALLLLFSILCSSAVAKSKLSSLTVGFYAYTCPQAETIVRQVVNKAVSLNPGTAADMIRMHFHDCFIRGCDGSVLLDSVPGKPLAEKDNFVNNPSLDGFEVIDDAKAQIEVVCPGTVSCADILAFAARDSALKAGWIGYDVPAGRRDGRVSLSSEVLKNLPPPSLNAAQLRDNFQRKGMSLDEMVTLSGAHSIGDAHCSTFASRLSGFNSTFDQDPSMDAGLAASLKTKCPSRPSRINDPKVDMDVQTPNRLDNKYYINLKNHKGLFTSDQTLYDSPMTRNIVVTNARYGSLWAKKFAAAMVKLGSIDVLTGNKGEIRRNCHFIN